MLLFVVPLGPVFCPVVTRTKPNQRLLPDCRKGSLCADYRDCRLGVGALFGEVTWRSKFWKTQQSARHANTPPFFRAGGAPHLVLVRICIMAFPDPCKPLRADWCYGFPILCSIAPSETHPQFGVSSCVPYVCGLKNHKLIPPSEGEHSSVPLWNYWGCCLIRARTVHTFGYCLLPRSRTPDFSLQNWVLHGCCGCRTAIQLLVDHWLPPF